MTSYFAYYIYRLIIPLKRGSIDCFFYFTTLLGFNSFLFSNIQKAFMLLFLAITVDFITGVYASQHTYVKKNSVKGFKSKVRVFFFEVFKSEKIRKSVLKTISYFLIILLAYFIETVFFLDKIPTQEIKQDLKITIWIITACSAIELYSAIFENIKKGGLDFKETITKGLLGIKTLYKEIKDFLQTFK